MSLAFSFDCDNELPADQHPQAELLSLAARLPTQDLLAELIGRRFAGQIALVSSFGADSAVLLHLVAQIDRATPIVFLDTGKLFGETLRYRDALVNELGLSNLRAVEPDPAAVALADNEGDLWRGNNNACCHLRKVEPLERALKPFTAWINGRKRFQGAERSSLPLIEQGNGRTKINALANWSEADVARYFAAYKLPRHPLEADGYSSIGCMPCTARTQPGEDARAGRWRGQAKTECGIHLDAARSTVSARPHAGC